MSRRLRLLLVSATLVFACDGAVPLAFSPDVVEVWRGSSNRFVVTPAGGFSGNASDYTLDLTSEAGAALSVRIVDLASQPLGGASFEVAASTDAPAGEHDVQLDLVGPDARYVGAFTVKVMGGDTETFDGGGIPPPDPVDPPAMDGGGSEPGPEPDPDDRPDAG